MAVTVFVAEDDKSAADSLIELLVAQSGVEVAGRAHTEVEAVDWLLHRTAPCDLLITDLLLVGGGSGFGIINHAVNLNVFRRIVVFSNFVTGAVAERCIRIGADAVFLKSDLEGLLAYVRSLTGGDDAVAQGDPAR